MTTHWARGRASSLTVRGRTARLLRRARGRVRCADLAVHRRERGRTTGGSTFCGLAALSLMGALPRALRAPDQTRRVRCRPLACVLSRWARASAHSAAGGKARHTDEACGARQWLLRRQVSGFQGRPHKDPDTCYAFWTGAAIAVRVCVWGGGGAWGVLRARPSLARGSRRLRCLLPRGAGGHVAAASCWVRTSTWTALPCAHS